MTQFDGVHFLVGPLRTKRLLCHLNEAGIPQCNQHGPPQAAAGGTMINSELGGGWSRSFGSVPLDPSVLQPPLLPPWIMTPGSIATHAAFPVKNVHL